MAETTDRFSRVRESLAGSTGYQRKVSTQMSDPSSFMPSSTWVVETMRNSERWIILLQSISAEGGQQFVIPDKVARVIYRHYDTIIRESKKIRAQAGADTRKRKKENNVQP